MKTIPHPIKILSYGCTTAAGQGVELLWNALTKQRDCSTSEELKVPHQDVPAQIKCAPFPTQDIKWNSDLEKLNFFIQQAFTEAISALPQITQNKILENCGVIFSSTKGIIEDLLRDEKTQHSDPLSPLLQNFIKNNKISTENYTCVSNACGSSHAALFLAKEWLNRGLVNNVIIVAAENVGSFIKNGFYSLKILNEEGTLPFSEQRRGLQLGEASSCIVLSNQIELLQTQNSKYPQLDGVSIVMEGTSLTRPSHNNRSLIESLENIGFTKKNSPNFILAHATGTRLNDASEAHSFSEIFSNSSPHITSTKWCIGHTLGVSGCIDLIAACEIFKNKKIFHMGKTKAIDPTLKGSFLIGNGSTSLTNTDSNKSLSCAITSLGFGGIHSALKVSYDG